MIKAYWNSLDIRQQRIVTFGAAFVVIALLLEFAIFPLWEKGAKMKKSIASNTRILNEVKLLDAEFAVQNGQISRIKQTLGQRRMDFTLFSHLEKKAQAANVKGNIKMMNTVPGVKSASFEESLIDLKLEKITTRQLTDFLYSVEKPAEMIRIKRMTISKMKDNPEYISVQLLVASYMPTAGQSGGPQTP